MMTTIAEIDHILQKVRRLEIKSKQLSDQAFTGNYHSAFKGYGLTFKEVKEYTPGDDPRFIDWNVSARMGNAYSKTFEEDRETNLVLMVDLSASSNTGTFASSKKATMIDICALLASSALKNGDKVGLIVFDTKVQHYLPPKKGKNHLLNILRTLVTFTTKTNQTNIITALQLLNKTTIHNSIAILLSDFADTDYARTLSISAKKNDIIGIHVYDESDKKLPKVGILCLEDIETKKNIFIDTNDPYQQHKYEEQFNAITKEVKSTFKNAGGSLLQIGTHENYLQILKEFFIKRA